MTHVFSPWSANTVFSWWCGKGNELFELYTIFTPFCYRNDTKSRYALMGLPDWTGMFRAYVWLEGCVCQLGELSAQVQDLFFLLAELWIVVPDLCGLRCGFVEAQPWCEPLTGEWLVGRGQVLVKPCVRQLQSLLIYVNYSRKNHSLVHRMLVYDWFP